MHMRAKQNCSLCKGGCEPNGRFPSCYVIGSPVNIFNIFGKRVIQNSLNSCHVIKLFIFTSYNYGYPFGLVASQWVQWIKHDLVLYFSLYHFIYIDYHHSNCTFPLDWNVNRNQISNGTDIILYILVLAVFSNIVRSEV